MKKYLLKTSIFLVVSFLIITFVLLKYPGNIDYFYAKFTSPKAKSMIIGDSRSMQGIQPRIINKELESQNIDLPIFNYSFTIAQAPIGPLYSKSIQRKLNSSVKNGIFIISITPWMFGSEKENDNEKGEFREAGEPPHNMHFVDVNPNYEYLVKNLNYFHFRTLIRKTSNMHADGWLEESNLPNNEKMFLDWKKNQATLFHDHIEHYKVSQFRIKSLDTLVNKLKSHGQVFLVRMPIDKDFIELENIFYKNFNRDMNAIAKKNAIEYINYNLTDEFRYKTYDGHHLDKFGGAEFSKTLSDTLKYFLK